MKKSSLQQSICRPYCAYYKPGRNEELACRGYEIAERLIASGVPLPPGGGADFDPGSAESLVGALCPACDFREDGCDFMLDRRARPCGGLVLLARLLKAGIIAIGDI